MSNVSSDSKNPPHQGEGDVTNDGQLTEKPGLFSFQGRIGRLGYSLTIVLATGLGMVFLLVPLDLPFSLLLLALFVMVKLIWLSMAVTVKRCHDVDKTGWLTLLFYVPYINIIFVLYLMLTQGTDGPNQYGPAPGGPPEQA